MELALLIDIGSTYTKVTAIDLETVELKGTAQAATTVAEDVNIGINKAIEELRAMGVEPTEAKHKLACSSAAGGLKMIAVGLVPELTSEAAKRAALGAGAKVGHVFCYELTDDELDQITKYSPDIILLAGGTDGGNKDVIIHNAKKLAELKVDAPIIVAGNKTAASAVEKVLRAASKEVYVAENVMPKLECLNIEPAKKFIREVFLNRIIYAKGLAKVSEYVDSPIIPTPSAVMKAAELLAKGSNNEAGLGDVMVVDIGGATTDVDSAATGEPTKQGVTLRGLEEPFVKRTVEGDLGMRYSALALVEEVGIKNILKNYLPPNIEEKMLVEYVEKISKNTDYVPCDDIEKEIDAGIAKAATDLAVKRHVGRIETVYSPFGAAYVQHGKDLTQLNYLIGTGGILIYGENPKEILKHGLYDSSQPDILAPENPKILLDEKYLLSSIGLLSEIVPDKALRLAKQYLKEI